jgi:cytochrome c peroxidase
MCKSRTRCAARASQPRTPTDTFIALVLVALGAAACSGNGDDGLQPQTGAADTVFTNGSDSTGPFFLSLGTNGRSCSTCHDPNTGWTVMPTALQTRFDATDGTDPIFRPVDGASSPNADVSTLAARRAAYAVLLDKGLIRVGLPIPAGAEFTLADVSDPHGYASATELSLFRRPLPAVNLRFVPEIMWDGREPSLASQATDATLGHAQATAVDQDTIAAIVAFESSIYSAQASDDVAGDLGGGGAAGGPQQLVGQPFQPGINDPGAAGFDRQAFTLFGAWSGADQSTPAGQRRAAIARGETIFNTEHLEIRGVAGLPDQDGTCSTCHDTPNVGNHSRALPMNTGVADADRRTPDLPLYTLRNGATGATVQTTDPGQALITGKWTDIGRFKVPSLRGLAARPPYFHNGSAANLDEVVRFYRQRFDLHVSDDEEADLVAFLSAL